MRCQFKMHAICDIFTLVRYWNDTKVSIYEHYSSEQNVRTVGRNGSRIGNMHVEMMWSGCVFNDTIKRTLFAFIDVDSMSISFLSFVSFP